jgi:hypothetical protein
MLRCKKVCKDESWRSFERTERLRWGAKIIDKRRMYHWLIPVKSKLHAQARYVNIAKIVAPSARERSIPVHGQF